MMKLYPFQEEILDKIDGRTRCALFVDMGMGKTFMSTEHVMSIAKDDEDILVVCQKSKISDWVKHWKENYNRKVYDYTKKIPTERECGIVIVVNYDLVWRRPAFKVWKSHLILDESSLIQNEKTKRTKFLLSMNPLSVTLLSGTPVAGKYENLWSQMQMLGWKIPKTTYWNNYVLYHKQTIWGRPIPITVVDGYKNVELLKEGLREHGAVFMRAEDAVTLPEVVESTVSIPISTEYRRFRKDRIIAIDGEELVGNTPLTQLLYERQLCGMYSKRKIEAMFDILDSSNDRFIVFTNFKSEVETLKSICASYGRPYGVLTGDEKNLEPFEDNDNAVLIANYACGAMGMNLQYCNRVVYFTPPLSSDFFMQSKARIHRIGQKRTCFYTYLICEGSVEERIYSSLRRKEDFTIDLFLTDTNR